MDLEARIAEMEADLSGCSLQRTISSHRDTPPMATYHREDSRSSAASVGSLGSSKPTGGAEAITSDSSSGSVTPRQHSEEDELTWDLEDEDETANEAMKLVQGVLPTAPYAERQRCAHQLATSLTQSAEAASELTARLEPHAAVMRSLLRLIDDAQTKMDGLTIDIVLACLTNLSGEETGRGLRFVMLESEAVAGLLVRMIDAREPTTLHYCCACLNNLKLHPAVVEALDVAQVPFTPRAPAPAPTPAAPVHC